jgi:hypothetical protein
MFYVWGRNSLVGIATGYGLDGPGIDFRYGLKFSTPVQTGPGAQPASCTMGTGSFLGVKSGRDVTLTPRSLLVPWSRRGRAIPLLPLWAVRPVQSPSAFTYSDYTSVLYRTVKVLVLASVSIVWDPKKDLGFSHRLMWNIITNI